MQRLAADPTLVGALTVLIVVVAVFLAYNANNGLPFVPTYRVSVQVPDADSLIRANDVRVGGIRVGTVQSVAPVQHANGTASAKLNLKLDKTVDPLPVDSTVAVRSKTALGLKYLQITPGKSSKGLPEGGTLGLAAVKPESVDIDQVLNIFDRPTRDAIQRNELEFGSALAARGPAINAAIGELRPVVAQAVPVFRNLASPSTGLGRFFNALEQTSAEVAPVAEQQAHQFVSLDTTFAAFAKIARPYLQETISKGPPTEDTTIRTLPQIRPFLHDSQLLFSDFRRASANLVKAGPALAAATTNGPPVLRKTPALNAELAPTAQALVSFGNTPGVTPGLQLLTQTNSLLDPTISFITPAQTVCNYVSLLLRNGSSIVSLGDGLGTFQRFWVIAPPGNAPGQASNPEPNNIGSPAGAPANGPSLENHLHYNPYPNTAAPGQPKECEAGNEPYNAAQTLIGNPPGNQGTKTEQQPVKKTKKSGKSKSGKGSKGGKS